MNVSREAEATQHAGGWELVGLRASSAGLGAVLWEATSARHDGAASMRLMGADQSAVTDPSVACAHKTRRGR